MPEPPEGLGNDGFTALFQTLIDDVGEASAAASVSPAGVGGVTEKYPTLSGGILGEERAERPESCSHRAQSPTSWSRFPASGVTWPVRRGPKTVRVSDAGWDRRPKRPDGASVMLRNGSLALFISPLLREGHIARHRVVPEEVEEICHRDL